MKERDRTAVSALRATLAAIDNKEAVDRPADADRNLAIESIPVGAGAAEVARRDLSETEVESIVRTEVDERLAAAQQYDAAGQTERAEKLRDEARVITRHLVDAP